MTVISKDNHLSINSKIEETQVRSISSLLSSHQINSESNHEQILYSMSLSLCFFKQQIKIQSAFIIQSQKQERPQFYLHQSLHLKSYQDTSRLITNPKSINPQFSFEFYITKLTSMQQQSKNSWQQFSEYFDLSPKYGYLIEPTLKLQTFDQDRLQDLLNRINGTNDQTIMQQVQEFQWLGPQKMTNVKQAFVIHDLTVAIVQKIIAIKRQNGVPDAQIRIPANIAIPLFVSSNFLGTKIGMNASIACMWHPTNDAYMKQDDTFGFGCFDLKFYLTDNKYQEMLFFGGSVVASFYLARLNKLAFQIGEFIQNKKPNNQEIIKKLDACVKIWDKITKENHKIIEEFNPDYFYHELRPRIGPFNRVVFQGANNGQDIEATSTGGTAGSDPSFQIFEKNFGLKFQGPYKKIQQGMRTGMIEKHRLLLDYLESSSQLRSYCKQNQELRKKYNEVLQAYVRFLQLHSKFVENFILKNMMKANPQSENEIINAKGTAGASIKHLMERYNQILSQYL